MTELQRLKNMFFLAFDLGVTSQTRGRMPGDEVLTLADAAWAKYIMSNWPLAGVDPPAGPVVVVSAPGVQIVKAWTCPDCGVTGDAMRRGKALPGEDNPVLCLACMEVE